MAKYKGIGINEMSTTFLYYTTYQNISGSNEKGWFRDTYIAAAEKTKEQYEINIARAWDDDLVRIGALANIFIIRGGDFDFGGSAGVFFCIY